MILAFCWCSRARAFYYALLFVAITFMQCLFKNVYHAPRPYWVEPRIQAFTCSYNFGNPSGHSIDAAALFLTVIFDVYLSEKRYYLKANFLVIYLTCSLDLFCIFLIGFSRMFNGVHSLDQVMLGGQMGVWLALFMHFIVREPLFNHVNHILKTHNGLVPKPFQKYILISSLCTFIIYALVILVYFMVDMFFEIEPEWIYNLMNKCG
mmetsp:Transcript_37538/g.27678  ORF Transcript_37538/g.27678 Transcript_37538/m.27678 type:complete len:207 (-) Transcript_37538:163-783(-)